MKPLLETKDLTVIFEGQAPAIAVENISFSLKRGEMLAIVGESGSGKSVTALSILRLLPQPPAKYRSGQILYSPDGLESFDLLGIDDATVRNLRGNRIAMIFQEPMSSLNPVHTCGSQVMESLVIHKKADRKTAKQKTIDLFEKVRLPEPVDMFRRYPHELSGGQKQRVMIAMAMSCNPDILIADEPTTALDVTVQKNILSLIGQLQEENSMGVIFITHDLGVVQEIADRIMVMYQGRVVEYGEAKNILSNPQHPYTRALLACRPGGKPKGERLPVVSDFLKIENSEAESVGVVVPLVSRKENIQGPLVFAENLSVSFSVRGPLSGRKKVIRAVDNVSLEIFAGETVGLVGESGSGKSTLGRVLLGLIKPDSGRLIIKGQDCSGFSRSDWDRLRKDVQVVFQDPYGSLNPRLTIGSALTEPLLVHHTGGNTTSRRSRVEALLKRVNLKAEYIFRYPHQFSGGQRQRIGIARALILEPGFIVFDESVSALDVSVQAQVLNLLRELKEEFGFTALFISHDLQVVNYISDRILVMYQGRIVESGTADQVLKNPKAEYTRKLVAAIPGNPYSIS